MLNILKHTALAFLIAASAIAQPLDHYHSNEEISAELLSLAESHPAYFTLDTIGYTGFYHLPILMGKVSTNPNMVQAKPAILFIGQVHAEEVIGVEMTLRLMRSMLDSLEDRWWRERLENLEVYFIPTLNPDGLEVVMRGIDVTFRKNCRDNHGDGRLRYFDGLGRDSSGVDLNRNFGLHWDRGDRLFYNNGMADAFNYYRGPDPFSEPETRALRDLMLSRRFLFSISYHSSRSGRNAELVIGPWNWEGKYPPDEDAIQALGAAIAERIPTQDGMTHYANVHAMMRVGQEQDWAYQATGSMMYMVELGATVQPDSTTLEQILGDAFPSALFLMDLAAGTARLDGYGIIEFRAIDAVTGAPLRAKVIPEAIEHPLLEPRLTDHRSGRIEFMRESGREAFRFEAYGYIPVTLDSVTIPNGSIGSRNIPMQPSPQRRVSFRLQDERDGERISGTITLEREDVTQTLEIPFDDDAEVTLPEGSFGALARSIGYLPMERGIIISRDTLVTMTLNRGEIAYSDDFSEFRNWQSGGTGAAWGVEEFEGRICLTESQYQPYAANARTWLGLETGVRDATGHQVVVEMIHRPYFEPGSDYAALEVYQPGIGQWIRVGTWASLVASEWDTTYIDLTPLNITGDQIRLRFWAYADGSVQEDGWLIDYVAVHYANEPSFATDDQPLLPIPATLSAFPNPANGAFALHFILPSPDRVEFSLIDVAGKNITAFGDAQYASGSHILPIAMPDLASGRYFVSMRTTRNRAIVIPLMLLK